MKKKLKLVLLLVVLSGVIFFPIYKKIKTRYVIYNYLNGQYWNLRVKKFAEYKAEDSLVIFVGNSLTENFGKFTSGTHGVLNFGINGDFTVGVLNRINQVISLRPYKIFLKIGINDIIEKVPVNEIEDNYIKIITEIRQKSPESKLFIQSILPTCRIGNLFTSNRSINERVIELNKFLHNKCEVMGCTYINLFDLYATGNDEMRGELTIDGIHLNEDGYRIWKRALTPYVKLGE